jgi:hypothetical protein
VGDRLGCETKCNDESMGSGGWLEWRCSEGLLISGRSAGYAEGFWVSLCWGGYTESFCKLRVRRFSYFRQTSKAKMFGLSKEQSSFQITSKCPLCNGWPIVPQYFKPNGNRISALTFLALMDREALAECPKCNQQWHVFAASQAKVKQPEYEVGLAEINRMEQPIGEEKRVVGNSKSPSIEIGSILRKDMVETFSILLLAADPTNASRLRIGEEFREIQEKLQLAKLREKFRIEQRTSIRPTDLSQVLLDLQPQILHFSGHGMESGALCFENQIGQIHPISSDALAALFEQFKDQVKCVLLNACYSEIQAIAISEHIDYVIGMNKAIGDKAAIAFAIGFYQGLGAGRTIEGAYKLGCVQVRLQGIPEHLTPILVKRGAVQT